MSNNQVFGGKKNIFLVSFFLVNIICWAQTTNASFFKIQTSKTTSLNIAPVLFETSGVFPLPNTTSVYGLSVSGRIVLKDETNSMVRITAECSDGIEYLVYETHPLLTDVQEFDVQDMALETAILQAENLTRLKITLLNASFVLQDVKYASSATEDALRTRQSLQKKQENAVIERLNENLEKKGMLWRAGNTSISSLSYEQKKAMFGDSMPYLGGFEYYKSGIFVTPDYSYAPAKASEVIPTWDWRCRHGKNWLSPIKNQGNCGSCWAFAAIGTLEAYVNLYYNNLLNIDLSEQNIVSCDQNNRGCSGGIAIMALSFLQNTGVVNEQCFPYIADNVNCTNICPAPEERIFIDRAYVCQTSTEDDLKKELFRAPIDMGIKELQHDVVLVGYKSLQIGDSICVGRLSDNNWVILESDNPLIGRTAWIIKNSYGVDFGENGYANIVANWDYLYNHTCKIDGKISSLQYTDDDIVIEDADGDGYYFWGIGERPQSLPAWVPEQADGDDSDPDAGPLDEFGYSRNLHPDNFESIYIRNRVEWTNPPKVIYPYIFIQQGGELIISGTTRLNRSSKIFVQTGGKLTIDGGTVEQADVMVSQGGTCILKNNGILRLGEGDSFKPEFGSVVRIESGSIQKQ